MAHKKRDARAGIAALLLVSVILLARSVRAAEAVVITGFSLTCSSAQVTYRVIGETNPEATASLQAYNASAALLGSASGPGYPDGTYTATVNFPPQSQGTSIYVVVSVPPAQATTSADPCYSSGEPGEPPVSESGPSAPPWGGYSDGRLNPDPAEYYSLWCAYDLLEIWRAVPSPLLLKTVSLTSLVRMEVGSTLDIGDFMTIVRHSSDTITVYGSNGNLAPNPGSKSFSLSECIARNGGLPPEPTSEPGRGGTNPPPATSLCADPEFFSENQESCLRELGFNDLGIQLIQLFFLCASGSLPGLALMVGIGRYLIWRRYRSHR